MKRLILSIVALLALGTISYAGLPSAITWNGASPDQGSLTTYLNNPTNLGQTSLGPIVPTGGITPTGVAPLRISNIPLGPVALASIGTNTTDINGQLWITDLFVPANKSITKVAFLQGATATTDNTMIAIYTPSGQLMAQTATGVTLSGANTFQETSLSATPVTLAGPATYYIAVQGNGTAAGAIQTLGSTYTTVRSSTAAGTFGTFPTTITLPTAFTAGQAPVVYVY